MTEKLIMGLNLDLQIMKSLMLEHGVFLLAQKFMNKTPLWFRVSHSHASPDLTAHTRTDVSQLDNRIAR